MKKETINVTIEDISLRLSVLRHEGSKPPVVFLHGFGASKEDYADFDILARFNDRAFLAYDALHGQDALGAGDMGQEHDAGDVAYGEEAGDVGGHRCVHFHVTPI